MQKVHFHLRNCELCHFSDMQRHSSNTNLSVVKNKLKNGGVFLLDVHVLFFCGIVLGFLIVQLF